MKKKLICGAAAIAMLLCLTGCKSNDYKAAQDLYEIGEYDAAIDAFEVLGDYKDSADMIDACTYGQALDLYDDEEYEEAAEIFEELGDYKDSEDMIESCADHAADAEQYDEASAIYDSLRQSASDEDSKREYAYLQLVNYIKANGEPFAMKSTDISDELDFDYAMVTEGTDSENEKAVLAVGDDDKIIFESVYEGGDPYLETENFYILDLYFQTLEPNSVESRYDTFSVIDYCGVYIMEIASGTFDITDYSDDYVFVPDSITYKNRNVYGEETEDDDYPLEDSMTESVLSGVTERTMPAISDMLAECGLTLNDLGYSC